MKLLLPCVFLNTYKLATVVYKNLDSSNKVDSMIAQQSSVLSVCELAINPAFAQAS